MSRLRLTVIAVLILSVASVVFGQAATTSGNLRGTVTDNSGAALPGVTVTVTNQGTGLTRVVITGDDGGWSAELLPPGTYKVVANLEGFGNASRENVAVQLGTGTTVNMKIAPQIAEEITVTATAPIVDTTQPDLAARVSSEQIQNLPLLGRDFTDLVKLTPGVTDTFNDGVSMNGGRGITANYNIDGAETNSDFFGQQRGGSRPPFTFSQAAIREFQVIRTSYSAEYSRGVGGTLNAITESGTNDIKGQAFYFFRDGGWADSRSATIAGAPVEENFLGKDSSQYGFSVGGPIVQDVLHFFVNTDQQDISEPVLTGDIRQRSQFLALPAETQATFIAKVEALLGYPFGDDLAYDTTEDQQTYLVKADWNVANNHHLSFRDNYSKFENEYNQPANNPLSRQGVETDKFNQAVLQAESVITPMIYNQLIIQYGKEERPIVATNNEIPDVNIASGSPLAWRFGHVDFLPNNTVEKKWQIKDNLTWIRGNHQLKTGVEFLFGEFDNFFVRDTFGEFQFSSIPDFNINKVSRFEQGVSAGDGHNVFEGDSWGIFFQDTMTIGTKLTIDAGIRYDVQSVDEPVDNVTPYPEFVDNFGDDTDNYAPRVGFAYDLNADGRSVIRGGVGKFFNFVPSILYANPLAQIAGITYNVSISCTGATASQCPAFPNLLPRDVVLGLPASSRDIAIIGADLEAQESIRGSIGYEQQLGSSYRFAVEGVYATLEKQQRFVNVNVVPTGQSYGNMPIYTVGGASSPYPAYQNVRQHVSDAEGEYTSATVSFEKFSIGGSKFSWQGHYTWAEAIDQDSNERSTSTSFSLDPFNPKLSEGRADYDATHRVVFSGTYELPWGIFVSGIYNWRSGYPYTMEISGLSNGANVFGINTPVFLDDSGNVIDMTLANGMTNTELQAFLSGAVLSERGTEDQPDYSNFDMRISKRFGIPMGMQVELIGEVFNAFNEDNLRFSGSSGGNRVKWTGRLTANKWTFTPNSSYGVANSFSGSPRQYQVAAKLIF